MTDILEWNEVDEKLIATKYSGMDVIRFEITPIRVPWYLRWIYKKRFTLKYYCWFNGICTFRHEYDAMLFAMQLWENYKLLRNGKLTFEGFAKLR
jgi:hypothetical protein